MTAPTMTRSWLAAGRAYTEIPERREEIGKALDALAWLDWQTAAPSNEAGAVVGVLLVELAQRVDWNPRRFAVTRGAAGLPGWLLALEAVFANGTARLYAVATEDDVRAIAADFLEQVVEIARTVPTGLAN